MTTAKCPILAKDGPPPYMCHCTLVRNQGGTCAYEISTRPVLPESARAPIHHTTPATHAAPPLIRDTRPLLEVLAEAVERARQARADDAQTERDLQAERDARHSEW